MKIGMKEEMGVADEMTLSFLGSPARKARTVSFASTVTFKEGNENRYEGEY